MITSEMFLLISFLFTYLLIVILMTKNGDSRKTILLCVIAIELFKRMLWRELKWIIILN